MKIIKAPLELDLSFTEPSAEQVECLEAELTQIADSLGVAAVSPLVLPEWGVLRRPLSDKQRRSVNDQLDPIYSRRFTDMQDGARDLEIQESGERMVDLAQVFDEAGVRATFTDDPINPYGGAWAGQPKVFWIREAVAAMHVRVAQAVDSIGLGLHFEDGFRPDGVQEGLFQKSIEWARAAHPDWDTESIVAQARSKVAIAPWIAGHKAGAATDTSFKDKDGVRLDPGNAYLETGANVILDFPYLTWEQYRVRQLFARTMEMAGLAVYAGEDWHASAGDVIAAMSSDNPGAYPIKYGPIKAFDPETGEVEPYQPEEYYEQFVFSIK